MIVSEKSHQNLSDYIQFLVQKDLNLFKNEIISCEKMRNTGNYIYDYTHSFFGKDFWSMIQDTNLLIETITKLKPI